MVIAGRNTNSGSGTDQKISPLTYKNALHVSGYI